MLFAIGYHFFSEKHLPALFTPVIADPMAKAALANTFAFRVFLKFFFEKDCIKNIILTFQVKKNRVVEVH